MHGGREERESLHTKLKKRVKKAKSQTSIWKVLGRRIVREVTLKRSSKDLRRQGKMHEGFVMHTLMKDLKEHLYLYVVLMMSGARVEVYEARVSASWEAWSSRGAESEIRARLWRWDNLEVYFTSIQTHISA
jgi:hypothetical protein